MKEFLNNLDRSMLKWALVAAILFYILPTIIAIFRNPTRLKEIFLTNLVAGFSFVGWFAVFIWAISGKFGKEESEKDRPAKDE